MSKRQVVGSMSDWSGVLKDMFRQFDDGSLTLEQITDFVVKHRNPFADLDYSIILADYEKYFRKIHDLKTDFAGIRIPEVDDIDFPWFVCRPENFFAERAYNGGKELYPKWKWTDESLGDVLDLSFGRDGNVEPHIARFRANWEADEDLANLSANQIAEKNINTACLTERLILGDFLFWKFKKHLDMNNITLCAGSRYSDGSVPDVSWSGGGLEVNWYSPGRHYDYLRSRRAVSI